MNKKDLAKRLRDERLKSGTDVVTAAKALSCKPTRIESLEEGEGTPSDFELLILDQLYGSRLSKEANSPFKALLSTLLPAFLSLLIVGVVNPFLPVFDFDGNYVSLMRALDVSVNGGTIPQGGMQAIIACLFSFLSVISLTFVFLLKKRDAVYSSVVFTVEFIALCSTLYPFKFGPYLMAITFLFGVFSFLWLKYKDRLLGGKL